MDVHSAARMSVSWRRLGCRPAHLSTSWSTFNGIFRWVCNNGKSIKSVFLHCCLHVVLHSPQSRHRTFTLACCYWNHSKDHHCYWDVWKHIMVHVFQRWLDGIWNVFSSIFLHDPGIFPHFCFSSQTNRRRKVILVDVAELNKFRFPFLTHHDVLKVVCPWRPQKISLENGLQYFSIFLHPGSNNSALHLNHRDCFPLVDLLKACHHCNCIFVKFRFLLVFLEFSTCRLPVY